MITLNVNCMIAEHAGQEMDMVQKIIRKMIVDGCPPEPFRGMSVNYYDAIYGSVDHSKPTAPKIADALLFDASDLKITFEFYKVKVKVEGKKAGYDTNNMFMCFVRCEFPDFGFATLNEFDRDLAIAGIDIYGKKCKQSIEKSGGIVMLASEMVVMVDPAEKFVTREARQQLIDICAKHDPRVNDHIFCNECNPRKPKK